MNPSKTASVLTKTAPSFTHVPVLLKECVSNILPSPSFLCTGNIPHQNGETLPSSTKPTKKSHNKNAGKQIFPPTSTEHFAEEQNTITKELHFVDATFGLGGYTRALLTTYPNSVVHAFDMDYHSDNGQVKLAAQSIWEEFGQHRLMISGVNFRYMHQYVQANLQSREAAAAQFSTSPPTMSTVHGIVFDLGVSSMQLDDASRGFSFRSQLDGPLDMRMGQFHDAQQQQQQRYNSDGGVGVTAKDIVNQCSEQELAQIIYEYGDEKYASKIARAIVNYRKKTVIETTGQLAQIVRSAVPVGVSSGSSSKDPSTKTFQAIRIHVNDELASIRDALIASEKLLCPGGRLCVVSYHSLEDRITKRFLQHNSTRERPLFNILTKDPIVPSAEEVSTNPRSRSAKLRVAERSRHQTLQQTA